MYGGGIIKSAFAMSNERKLFFKFELHKRIYEGNYNYNDFMHYCYIVLHNQYPFLPKELILSRAKFIWNKKLKETNISSFSSKESNLPSAKITKKDKVKLNNLSINIDSAESPIYTFDSPTSISTIHPADDNSSKSTIWSIKSFNENLNTPSLASFSETNPFVISDVNHTKDSFQAKNIKCSISELMVPLYNNYDNMNNFFKKEQKKLTTTIEPSFNNMDYYDFYQKISISDNIIKLDHNND